MVWKNVCTCIKCGTEFKSRSRVARFCSDLCGKQHRKATGEKTRVLVLTVTHTKQCVECQQPFTSKNTNAIRCSDKCRRAGFKKQHPDLKKAYQKKYRDKVNVREGHTPGTRRNKSYPCVCKQCQMPFESAQSVAQYCSHKCRMMFFAKNESAQTRFVVRKRYDKVCEVCGEAFVTKRKTAKLCSGACVAASWRKRNPEKAKSSQKAFRNRHKEKIRVRTTKYIREKYNSNPAYRLKRILGNRLRQLIRRRKMDQKHGKTLELIGCSWPFLRDYIASMFRDGMSWENFGEVWQIDHRLPVTSFNLFEPAEQKRCFHFSNLQPLFKDENARKLDQILPPELYLRPGHSVPSGIC